MKYAAQEREWVRRILVTLTPTERQEYERLMAQARGNARTGRKYDALRAKVAEMVKARSRALLAPAPGGEGEA